ncbi:uncharacterized protein LOC129769592 [Toxorhynchites rutilus septentrionalis]|uniref:uncharacterized protein LOC129769592 n=1 Tax=Toxorhynchites rutilus septentrionalis TaxID=329112 RepID=UPI00247A2471|nr:uncharacterized protein LOC129769592 [Toxorhynchites rutilus septentrionalis]
MSLGRSPTEKSSTCVVNRADSNDLSVLIHLRNVLKTKLTRMKNSIQQAEENGVELTVSQVKVYSRKLEATYSEHNDLHQRIMNRIVPEKREEQDSEYFEFEALQEEICVFLEECLENLPAAVPSPANPSQQPLVITQPLPRAIPTFDGSYTQWEKFKVMFRDVVDKSNEPPRIKLYHLEKALIGDAAGLIDARTISDGNYEQAWRILEERFEDKRRMIILHIDGLFGVQQLSHESHTELRSLVECVSGNVENLKFLGQDLAGIYEHMVIHLLTQALDGETRKLWETTIKRGELPSYYETIAFLKERVSLLERCQAAASCSQHEQTRSILRPTVPFAAESIERIKPLRSLKCDFCGNNHQTLKCADFNQLSVDERCEMVKQNSVCFNCLRRGHRVFDCPSPKSCTKCHRRHHSLLHHNQSEKPINPLRRTHEMTPVSSPVIGIMNPVTEDPSNSQPSRTTAHSVQSMGDPVAVLRTHNAILDNTDVKKSGESASSIKEEARESYRLKTRCHTANRRPITQLPSRNYISKLSIPRFIPPQRFSRPKSKQDYQPYLKAPYHQNRSFAYRLESSESKDPLDFTNCKCRCHQHSIFRPGSMFSS